MENIKTTNATLCFPVENGRILLGKKKHKLGAGFWNGFGGKVEAEETIVSAAVRELEEECGLRSDIENMKQVAQLLFHYTDSRWNVHVFFVAGCKGEIRESNEMEKAEWFAYEEIPYTGMWADDREWLPRVLAGEMVKGEVFFNSDNKTIASMYFGKVASF